MVAQKSLDVVDEIIVVNAPSN